jgi:hypothetical protein
VTLTAASDPSSCAQELKVVELELEGTVKGQEACSPEAGASKSLIDEHVESPLLDRL